VIPEPGCPRLSQAKILLPLLRVELGGAASHYSLPAGLEVDLLPIVEDGLFGYEVLPNRDTHTYVTLGADADGAPVVRKNLYCSSSPSALRLAAASGRTLMQHELDAWDEIEQRDTRYPDWPSAAAAVWAELAKLFAERPRHTISIRDAGHAAFDDTLAIAQRRLRDCDPWIEFCGIPDEAQYGFVLKGAHGEHGNLVLRSRGSWELHWTTPLTQAHDHWPATLLFDGTDAWARAGEAGDSALLPVSLGVRDDQRKAARRRR